MARDLHKKAFDTGTLEKLGLFRLYIDAWVSIFILSGRGGKKVIRIFDFFSGPGKDSSGRAGSPLLIIASLMKAAQRIRDDGITIELYFNDKSAKKIKQLKAEIDALPAPVPATIHYSSVDFPTAYAAAKLKLGDGANLLLIDQNGIKFFTREILLELSTFSCTDFITFFSSSFCNRFRDIEAMSQYLNAANLGMSWGDYPQIHNKVVDYFRTQLPVGRGYYLAPFTLKKGSNIYGLIFGSGHPLGLLKFLEAAWTMDAERGEANFDIDGDKLDDSKPCLFEDMNKPKKLNFFERDFERAVMVGAVTDTRAAFMYCLERGMLPKHARPVLQRLVKEGVITATITGFGYDSWKNPLPITVGKPSRLTA